MGVHVNLKTLLLNKVKKAHIFHFFQVICVDSLKKKKIRYKQIDKEIFTVSVLMFMSTWLSKSWMAISGTGTATAWSTSSLCFSMPVISSISLFSLTPSSRLNESLVDSCCWISVSLSLYLSCSGSLSLWFDSGSLSYF